MWTENVLKTKLFENMTSRDLLARDFLKHQYKMTGDFAVSKFLRLRVDLKHLMHFQNENFVFKFSGVVWTGL